MQISRIALRNIRGIQRLDLRVLENGRPRQRTIFVGKNGTSKSSILRAIAIGLASPTEASALLAEPNAISMITGGGPSAEITLWLQPPEGGLEIAVRKQIFRRREIESIQGDAEELPEPPFVIGFGAARALEGSETGAPYSIVETAHSLFNYEGTFIQSELTLRRLNDFLGDDRYKRATRNIMRALGLGDADTISLPRGGGVEVSGPSVSGGPIPLQAWADGYRVTLHWILDIYGWAMRHGDAINPDGTVDGIILIDEVEQHLHPAMQEGLLNHLEKLFPNLQVFATTHSPLVVLGSRPEDLVPLRRPRKWVTVGDVPDFTGYSAEDILTATTLFETAPYSSRLNQQLARYRTLRRKSGDSRTEGEASELDRLSRVLGRLRSSVVPEELAEELAQLRRSVEKIE